MRFHLKHVTFAGLLILSLTVSVIAPVHGEDSTNPVEVAAVPALTSHGLLSQLERFLQQREIDINLLTVDAMVGVMVDWARFSRIDSGGDSAASDALVYQYGGWSEGCATAFKLSLLRKVSGSGASGEVFSGTAGITLIFEPGANTGLEPFRLVASNPKSIDAFLAAIESSPAFRKLAAVTPMSVMVESGGMR